MRRLRHQRRFGFLIRHRLLGSRASSARSRRVALLVLVHVPRAAASALACALRVEDGLDAEAMRWRVILAERADGLVGTNWWW